MERTAMKLNQNSNPIKPMKTLIIIGSIVVIGILLQKFPLRRRISAARWRRPISA